VKNLQNPNAIIMSISAIKYDGWIQCVNREWSHQPSLIGKDTGSWKRYQNPNILGRAKGGQKFWICQKNLRVVVAPTTISRPLVESGIFGYILITN